MTYNHQQILSNNTKFSQDRVYAMDNMMMVIISHVIRLWRHQIDKNGESQYGRVHFICTHNLKRLFGEGILGEGILFLFFYKVPFTYQLKNYWKKYHS